MQEAGTKTIRDIRHVDQTRGFITMATDSRHETPLLSQFNTILQAMHYFLIFFHHNFPLHKLLVIYVDSATGIGRYINI
jgi:hypothetical protein